MCYRKMQRQIEFMLKKVIITGGRSGIGLATAKK